MQHLQLYENNPGTNSLPVRYELPPSFALPHDSITSLTYAKITKRPVSVALETHASTCMIAVTPRVAGRWSRNMKRERGKKRTRKVERWIGL
jgi:hypothetical protein